MAQVTKGRDSLSFYSLPEFQEWKEATENFHTWKVKYYKGESAAHRHTKYFILLSMIPFI